MSELNGYNQNDQYIFDTEIKPFLPQKVFDAHTHLCSGRFAPDLPKAIAFAADPSFGEVTLESLRSWQKMLFPAQSVNSLVLGYPTAQTDIAAHNEFLASQCTSPGDRISILCRPDTKPKQLEEWIRKYKPAGLKPYMCFSKKKNFNESDITDLIPEPLIALADTYNLSITLHVAKVRGMADEKNIKDIAALSKKYKNCNFILAHCGRCFISPNMEHAAQSILEAENIWFDTSAVCDTGVFLWLFSKRNPKQILFGTDLVTAAAFRGSYIRLGTSWDIVTSDALTRPGGQTIKATFAAYENLCALFCAARFCGLKENQIHDIFYANAQRLFKL